MPDNSQQQSNNPSTQQSNHIPSQDNNVVAIVVNPTWVNVNTSDSIEAQRMNIMKGNNDELFTKSGR